MLALLVATTLLQAPLALALNAHPQDAWTVELRERFLNTAEEFDETDVWREEYRIAETAEAGTRVTFKRTFLHTELDGNKIPPAKGNEPITGEWTLRPVGGRVPFHDNTQAISASRLSRLEAQGVWFPEGKVGVGARWGLELQRDGQIPGAKASWWLMRIDELKNRPCAVIGFQFVEDPAFDYPMTARGERWVDTASGLVLQETITTSNVPIPGGTFRVQQTVTRKLIECALKGG